MTKDTLRTLASEIELAVQEVAKKHGVQIKRGNGTYTSNTAVLKLDISDIVDGVVEDKTREAFLQNAKWLGLDPLWLDKHMILNGTGFRITGLNNNASKNCVLIERNADKKGFATTTYATIIAMKRA
jgi:hypothetical protein